MLTELSRPSLAVLNEDFPKVKNVESKQEINGLINFLVTVLNIKISNDDDKNHLDRQMILILDLIKTKFGSLTIPEIQEAFKMFVAREFPEIKVFRVLDCVVVGEVLNAFKEFRNESLRTYDQKKLIAKSKPMSEEQIKSNHEQLLQIIFDDLQKSDFSEDAWMIYDEMELKIGASSEERKALYTSMLAVHVKEFSAHKKARESLTASFAIQELQNKIKRGEVIQSVANKCKSILVSKYLHVFKNFHEFKKVIEL